MFWSITLAAALDATSMPAPPGPSTRLDKSSARACRRTAIPAPPRASIVFSDTSHPSAVLFSSTPAPTAQLMWLRRIWAVLPGPTLTVPLMRHPTSVDEPDILTDVMSTSEARVCGRLGEPAVDGRAVDGRAVGAPFSVRPSSVPESRTIGPRSVAPGASATSVNPEIRNGPGCTPAGTVTVSPGRAAASAAFNDSIRRAMVVTKCAETFLKQRLRNPALRLVHRGPGPSGVLSERESKTKPGLAAVLWGEADVRGDASPHTQRRPPAGRRYALALGNVAAAGLQHHRNPPIARWG